VTLSGTKPADYPDHSVETPGVERVAPATRAPSHEALVRSAEAPSRCDDPVDAPNGAVDSAGAMQEKNPTGPKISFDID
jgi:hypothetical protein